MAEYPSLPLFTDAYLADTRHLTTLQHGAYLLMLMTAWRSTDCALPNDETYLARICGMDKRTWASNRDVILSFWSVGSDAKLFQKRLKDERQFVEQKRNKNSASGKASALKRLNRGSTNVQPDFNQNSTPTPTPTPIYMLEEERASSNPPTPKKPKYILPSWVPIQEWKDFEEMRVRIKKPMTDAARKGNVEDLQKLVAAGHDAAAVLSQSVKNSWAGLFKIKEEYNATTQRNTNGNGYINTPKPTKTDRTKEAVRRAYEAYAAANPVK
jgi:uncharacterized protein YdaU (DUF1376 family)